MSIFLCVSSGWGIGGIQLTEILLCSLLAYSVVNYKKPVCIVVFFREAMKRCGMEINS